MKALLARCLTKNLAEHPVFVVGTGRSGTSILLQALGAHPLIFAARGEAPLISFSGHFMASFEPKNLVVNNYLHDSIKIPRNDIYACLKQLNFEVSFGREYGFRQVVKALLQHKFGFLKKEYWAAKIFSDGESCRGLRCLYPKAKFIYIVRNGLNVVQSRMHFAGFKHDSFADHCQNWQNDCQKYAYLETEDYTACLFYEELLESPDQFFEKLFDNLDIPLDRGPTEYVKNNLIHPLNQVDSRGVDVKAILKSRPEPYAEWSEEQKQIFLNICASGMKKYGYEIPFS